MPPLSLAFTVACRINRLLGNFLYKIVIFMMVENHLIVVKKLQFLHQLFVLMWEVCQRVLAAKYSVVVKLSSFKLESMKKALFSIEK